MYEIYIIKGDGRARLAYTTRNEGIAQSFIDCTDAENTYRAIRLTESESRHYND